mmetsp:Transcript_77861/g.170577  ORF Transcript_77861/g.170577 Transcript_77861/m.170577 type:complete len:218 (+) Transcript_77861:792-1445(+)
MLVSASRSAPWSGKGQRRGGGDLLLVDLPAQFGTGTGTGTGAWLLHLLALGQASRSRPLGSGLPSSIHSEERYLRPLQAKQLPQLQGHGPAGYNFGFGIGLDFLFGKHCPEAVELLAAKPRNPAMFAGDFHSLPQVSPLTICYLTRSPSAPFGCQAEAAGWCPGTGFATVPGCAAPGWSPLHFPVCAWAQRSQPRPKRLELSLSLLLSLLLLLLLLA